MLGTPQMKCLGINLTKYVQSSKWEKLQIAGERNQNRTK